MVYSTKEIADSMGVHPNTVRVYEEWGYLSPAPRADNGYRQYDDIHLFQLKIARFAFRCEIIQGSIRKSAREIVLLSGQKQFLKAYEQAEEHLLHLNKEYERAVEAADIAESWLYSTKEIQSEGLSRQQVAEKIQLHPELIRNWERNGLITIPRNEKGYRVFTEKEINMLKVIRVLRMAHYSYASILRLVQQAKMAHPIHVKEVLNLPENQEDIVYVTDRLLMSLKEAIADTKTILTMLREKNDGD